jgi:multiple sugar transport system permease protein
VTGQHHLVTKNVGLNVNKIRWHEARSGILYVLPTVVILFVFVAIPMGDSFWMSFRNWNLFGSARFIGPQNYLNLMHDPIFRQSAWNTLYFTAVSVPLTMIIALGVAVLLNRPLRFSTVYRTAFFAPVVTSMVAVSLVWSLLFDPNYGILDFLLNVVGLRGVGWLSEPGWAMLGIVLVSAWKSVGWDMLIFLAGLQGVPESLYEAARIDGATGWRQFRHITWPLLTPTTFFILVMSIIGSFQVFDQVYVMTGGGPINSTNVVVFYIYEQAFQFFHMGYASAMAWVLFAAIFIVTVIQFKFIGRGVNYDVT